MGAAGRRADRQGVVAGGDGAEVGVARRVGGPGRRRAAGVLAEFHVDALQRGAGQGWRGSAEGGGDGDESEAAHGVPQAVAADLRASWLNRD